MFSRRLLPLAMETVDLRLGESCERAGLVVASSA